MVERPIVPVSHVLNDIMCFVVTSKLQLATETVQAVALRAYS